jgi:hypothetical protein
MALADVGESAEAEHWLREALGRARRLPERALLAIHTGVRLAETGHWGAAAAITHEAAEVAANVTDGAVRDTLMDVANRNAVQFSWFAGSLVQPSGDLYALSRLGDIDGQIASALEAYAKSIFDASTEDPLTRRFSWSAQDPVEAPLVGALLRAEALADWSALMRTRRLLGRYRLLASVGQEAAKYENSVFLLRRSGDHDGIERAVRLLYRNGPLGPLRNAALGVLATPWHAQERQSNLVILGAAASVLDEVSANSAVSLLLTETANLGSQREGRNEDPRPLFAALGRLLSVAPGTAHPIAARTLREVVEGVEANDALVLQAVGVAIRALRWPDVPAAERRRWVDFVRLHLTARDDTMFAARAAAVSMSESNARVSALVRRAFREQPTLYLASLVLTTVQKLRAGEAKAITDLAVEAAIGMRAAAADGRYMMGVVDVGAVLTEIALRTESSPAWNNLVQFLLDDRMPADQRRTSLELLASRPDDVPVSARDALTQNLRQMRAPDVPLFGGQSDIAVSAFRLAVALRAISAADALGMLLAFAAGDMWQRWQASRALGLLRGLVPNSELITVALLLASDKDPIIRASVARHLPHLAAEAPHDLGVIAFTRVAELVVEAGGLVPREALLGLAEAVASAESWHTLLQQFINRIADGHLDATVREAAMAVRDGVPRAS